MYFFDHEVHFLKCAVCRRVYRNDGIETIPDSCSGNLEPHYYEGAMSYLHHEEHARRAAAGHVSESPPGHFDEDGIYRPPHRWK